MTFKNLLSFSALTLCVIILSQQVHAISNHDFIIVKKTEAPELPPLEKGLCASFVTNHGYKCQELEITTKDGYILSVQRIPESRSGINANLTKKQPVIVQHGVMVDGTSWFLNRPEQNLPMILADSGFDVWVINTRGTRYSRKHVSKNPNSKEYWDWSWDQMVTYDMPAIFDYISKQTGQKVHYVGHSLGTLVALGFLSERKIINQIKSVALLSPIGYLSHMTTEIGQVAARSLFSETYTLMGFPEFDPKSVRVVDYITSICAHPGMDCNDLFTAITGENCCLSSKAFDQYMWTGPQPSSTMTMVQLAQNVRTGFVAKYDYERPDLNLLHYGHPFPPKYNFSNIPPDVPIFMSYGGKDALSDVMDVKILLNDLSFHNKDKLVLQFVPNYGHSDFIMALNANEQVYKTLIEFIKRKF